LSNRIFKVGAFGLLAIASISLKRSLMTTSKAGLIWEILYSLKAGTRRMDLSIFEQWVVRIPAH
jgi:hypothetical protein